MARAHWLGLVAEPVEAAPLDPAFDEPLERRPADQAFWAEPAGLVAARVAAAARLLAWPDLSPDVDEVLASLPDDLFELVWEDAQERLASWQANRRLSYFRSAWHRRPLILGGHQRYRPACKNPRSRGIHCHGLRH